MKRLVLVVVTFAACSKSAPDAEHEWVQPAPLPSDEGGANPLDGVARETAEDEPVVPPEEPPPPEQEQALDETAVHDPPRPMGDPMPPPEPVNQPSMNLGNRRRGDPLEQGENALQLDE